MGLSSQKFDCQPVDGGSTSQEFHHSEQAAWDSADRGGLDGNKARLKSEMPGRRNHKFIMGGEIPHFGGQMRFIS